MIIKNKTRVLSYLTMAMSLASCTKISSVKELTASQVQNVAKNMAESTKASRKNENPQYPASALIYNVCHERWLRNGYTNYMFNIEEGVYVPTREVQRGRFTQTVVANHRVSQSSTCELSYHASGADCNPSTRKRSKQGRTIEGLFASWEKNPGLYQSCHPVLGYPTGFGHTYGANERRIDSSKWFLVSSVVSRRSSQASTPTSAPTTEQRVASPTRTKKTKVVKKKSVQKKKTQGDFASVSDLDIKLVSSRIKKSAGRSSLVSQFNVANQTDLSALLGIKGWILDKNYKRFPLSVDGKKLKKGEDSQVVTLEVEPHTQMTISYEADGVSGIDIGKQTVGVLEIMSVDGVKVNLTLPNR